MNGLNVREQHKKKYFYTVLFLNDYFPPEPEPSTEPTQTKVFDIMEDTCTSDVKWRDENTLWVRHNLQLPITLEMWDDTGTPIFYCPILKDDIDSLSIGEIVKESDTSLLLNFENLVKPTGDKVYKFALRSLPMFDLKNQIYTLPQLPLDEEVIKNRTGLAIVFRRHSLDALFDLIAQFDESYWHSLEQNFDLQYLTKKSCYKNCFFACKYTNNLQDAVDLINPNTYEIKFSWNNAKRMSTKSYIFIINKYKFKLNFV